METGMMDVGPPVFLDFGEDQEFGNAQKTYSDRFKVKMEEIPNMEGEMKIEG